MADQEDTALVASTEEETDLDIFEEMGIDADVVDKEVAKLSTEKVELDTYGLDLDLLSEDEPEEEPIEEFPEEPAEDQDGDAEEAVEDEPPKAKRPKWFLPAVGGGGLLVLAGAAAALWFFVFKPEPPPPAPKVAQQTEAKQQLIVTQRPIDKPSLDLREFLVPRKGDKETVLRVSLFLVFVTDDSKKAAEARMIELRNAVYQGLLDQADNDLRTDEAKLALQDEIAEAVNRGLGQEWVTAVYFTDFLIL